MLKAFHRLPSWFSTSHSTKEPLVVGSVTDVNGSRSKSEIRSLEPNDESIEEYVSTTVAQSSTPNTPVASNTNGSEEALP